MISRMYLVLVFFASCWTVMLYISVQKMHNVNRIATLQNSSKHKLRNAMRTISGTSFSSNAIRNNSQSVPETITHPTERKKATYKTFNNTKCYIRCANPMGRLGNQMFGFASTLGIADTLDCKPIISQSHPLLKFFNIISMYISDMNLTNMMRIKEEQWKNTHWKQQELFRNHNLTILGYLQSWKYFTKISGIIKKSLTVKTFYMEKAKLFLKSKISGTKIVIGIHVRRGDFNRALAWKRGRVVATKTYLASAMGFYQTRFKNSHFVVCSDDMKWCQKNIKGPNVTFSVFREPIVDMAILSMCNHSIITAGSFGWWSGWLAGGTVVYLSDFPRPGTYIDMVVPKKSYYPPEWIGINNKGLIANTTI